MSLPSLYRSLSVPLEVHSRDTRLRLDLRAETSSGYGISDCNQGCFLGGCEDSGDKANFDQVASNNDKEKAHASLRLHWLSTLSLTQ